MSTSAIKLVVIRKQDIIHVLEVNIYKIIDYLSNNNHLVAMGYRFYT